MWESRKVQLSRETFPSFFSHIQRLGVDESLLKKKLKKISPEIKKSSSYSDNTLLKLIQTNSKEVTAGSHLNVLRCK